MALLDSLGLSGMLPKVNAGGILQGVGSFALLLLGLLIAGGIFFYWYNSKLNAQIYNKRIFWWEDVNGTPVNIDEDVACELTIPNTDTKVFYIKKKDLYIPRPIIAMGRNTYWLAIKKNRQVVNFKMGSVNYRSKDAPIEYDHTEMLLADANLADLIRRNYRDKAQVWWKEYKEVIAVVVLTFVMSLSFFFLLGKIGGLLDKLAPLIEHIDGLLKTATTANQGSGVVQA